MVLEENEEGKIKNPETGRFVNKDGKIGKKLMKEHDNKTKKVEKKQKTKKVKIVKKQKPVPVSVPVLPEKPTIPTIVPTPSVDSTPKFELSPYEMLRAAYREASSRVLTEEEREENEWIKGRKQRMLEEEEEIRKEYPLEFLRGEEREQMEEMLELEEYEQKAIDIPRTFREPRKINFIDGGRPISLDEINLLTNYLPESKLERLYVAPIETRILDETDRVDDLFKKSNEKNKQPLGVKGNWLKNYSYLMVDFRNYSQGNYLEDIWRENDMLTEDLLHNWKYKIDSIVGDKGLKLNITKDDILFLLCDTNFNRFILFCYDVVVNTYDFSNQFEQYIAQRSLSFEKDIDEDEDEDYYDENYDVSGDGRLGYNEFLEVLQKMIENDEVSALKKFTQFEDAMEGNFTPDLLTKEDMDQIQNIIRRNVIDEIVIFYNDIIPENIMSKEEKVKLFYNPKLFVSTGRVYNRETRLYEGNRGDKLINVLLRKFRENQEIVEFEDADGNIRRQPVQPRNERMVEVNGHLYNEEKFMDLLPLEGEKSKIFTSGELLDVEENPEYLETGYESVDDYKILNDLGKEGIITGYEIINE